MKFFVDTGDINEISTLVETGMVDGVTTNPSLVASSGKDFVALVRDICQLVPGHVSAEVLATDVTTMLKEAEVLRTIADNVCIKVPLTVDGLKACKALSAEGTAVNVTLCFSAVQALLAAKAGATYVSPFIGRLDDVGESGMQLIRDIVNMYDNYPNLHTQVLAASIRSPSHVLESAMAGAHVATLPPKIIWQLYNHPLTDKGLAAFLKDWEKTGQKLI
ncbi:fructose-6-phosphate aldolase [Thiothrix winogradskyi]|uniref:Fructose-6-phosphate aldolase n=1 Tax=Thiothrix winogradskyi TaxID=96472 RepID=A0ABY3T3B6_9GAMM|nr:fructose-6-phosphate aldolase [Thiothrix winogradskyi]UJS25013.1 fructose-6-phosphate aldolase [Thiothrix winogradskyi]